MWACEHNQFLRKKSDVHTENQCHFSCLISREMNLALWIMVYIYILGVLIEKPCSKPLECNVVYVPIITLSHATSHDFK